MKKLLPILLVAVAANARVPEWASKSGKAFSNAASNVASKTKNAARTVATKTKNAASSVSTGTKNAANSVANTTKNAANAVVTGTGNAYNNVAKRTAKVYNAAIGDTVYLGSNQAVSKYNGETKLTASNDAAGFSQKLKFAMNGPSQIPSSNSYESVFHRGLVLNGVQGNDWEDVAAVAKDSIIKAAGSEYISKALYNDAITVIANSLKVNCGIWSSKEEAVVAVTRADLSFITQNNADFLEAKRA